MYKAIPLILLFISTNLFAQKQGYYDNLDSATSNPNRVITLELKKKNLKEVPKEVFSFPNLERLLLSRNYIRSIPFELSNLKRLHYLDLSSNYIEEFPQELGALPLDTLILWDNQIRVFPSVLQTLGSALQYLDLRAIQMNKEEQTEIKLLFPLAHIRLDHPCNCGAR